MKDKITNPQPQPRRRRRLPRAPSGIQCVDGIHIPPMLLSPLYSEEWEDSLVCMEDEPREKMNQARHSGNGGLYSVVVVAFLIMADGRVAHLAQDFEYGDGEGIRFVRRFIKSHFRHYLLPGEKIRICAYIMETAPGLLVNEPTTPVSSKVLPFITEKIQ